MPASFGSTRFATTATRNTTATQFCANTLWISSGKFANRADTCVKPMPTASDSAAMRMLRCEKPARAIIWKPLTMMLPNIMMVQPPSTASGSDAKITLITGRNAARIMMTAPVAMALRFTTFVMATRPTFCENDVIGRQPKHADSELTKPSQAMEPESSFSFTSRLRPTMVSAEVSPIVSVADTRKISVTDTIAPRLNSGVNGMSCGSANSSMFWKPLKSTAPATTAHAYPMTRPNSTESCLVLPFASTWNTRHETSEMVPSSRFCGDPKSAAPEPPPNEEAPTPKSEKPMDVTTTAATMGDMMRRQYFANRPSTPSMMPPTMMAPMATLYPYVAAMPTSTVTNVKLMPMTMGRPDPTRHSGNSWMSVPMPAMSMALCTSMPS